MIPHSINQRRLRSALLALGLLAVSAGVVLVAAASRTTVVVVDQDLRHYWRTTYDLLVRPAGARSAIEEQYGLVEANHLSGIDGGITTAQYEAINAIPGVEVAAPIAMLGYVTDIVQTDSLGQLSAPGAYVVEQTLISDDGARLYDSTNYTYYYVGPDASPPSPGQPPPHNYPLVNQPFPVLGWLEMPFLMAAIDPPQEAALVGLDRALVKGAFLTGDEPLSPRPYTTPYDETPRTEIDAPVLINASPYISMTLRAELKQLALPAEASDFEAIMARGGTRYLATLRGERLSVEEIRGEEAHHSLVETVQEGAAAGSDGSGTVHGFATSTPSQITYRETLPPFSYAGLVLEILPPEGLPPFAHGQIAYRAFAGPWSEDAKFNAVFMMDVKGVFNIERIPKPADVNRVPLETYFPPLATLRYDEEGRPVEPRTLRPTINTSGYVQSPPLVLTTLSVAQTLCGDACISAIRVRVGGIDELTPAAHRKIEAVASEIARRTDLTVDVMVGSSPRRVLVRVPEVGYVEEGWIQKGVNVSYHQRVQGGHWLLLGVLLAIGGVYTLDLAWADVVAQRRAIALQKALGWRSRTVFGQVVGQVLAIGTLAGVTGALGALGAARQLGWQSPQPSVLAGVPLVMIGLCVVGSLYPAWLASRVPPIAEIKSGGTRYRRRVVQQAMGQWSHAWRTLMRRPARTAISAVSAALAAALLVLLLAVTLEQHGELSGTLLGEFILVRIEGFHYAIVGIGLGLGALSTANALLSDVVERQREIGILKAVGWRTATVARLFVMEGALLGLMGGVIGALLGVSIFLNLYRTLSPGLAGIVLLGVGTPGLVGVAAALYPALVAARVLPAEAVRSV